MSEAGRLRRAERGRGWEVVLANGLLAEVSFSFVVVASFLVLVPSSIPDSDSHSDSDSIKGRG